MVFPQPAKFFLKGRTIKGLAAVLAMVLLLCWLVPWWRARDGLRAARTALDEGRLTQARSHLELLVQQRPGHPEVHFLLAQLARRQLRYQEALQHLQEAGHRGWPDKEIEMEQLLIDAQRGHLPRVVNRLRTLIAQDHPHSPMFLEALAQGYSVTYRYGDAHGCLDFLLQKQPDHVLALYRRGKILDHLGHFQQAEKDYAKAVELDEDAVDARLALGDLLLRLHRPGEALGHFQRLARNQAELPAARFGLAQCQRQLGKWAEAQELLRPLLPQPNQAPTSHDVPILCEWAQMALAENRPADAQPFLVMALKALPFDRQANYLMAQCLERQGLSKAAVVYHVRLKKIQADLERLRQLSKQALDQPGDVAARCEAGKLLLELGQTGPALRWLTSALQEDPEHKPTHQLLADHYRAVGNRERADFHEGKSR